MKALDYFLPCLIIGALAYVIHTEEEKVPLELKGLKSNMLRLQGTVDRLNTIASKANDKGSVLESHLIDIGKQLGSHVDDIEFAANVLGNSSNGSGEVAEEPDEKKATEAPPAENIAPQPAVSGPEVPPVPRFQSQ